MSTVINLYKNLCEYRDTKHSTISLRIISEKVKNSRIESKKIMDTFIEEQS